MRLIKRGGYQWGPKEKKCSKCGDTYEVTMDDLAIVEDMCEDQRDGPYKCDHVKWTCATCGEQQNIYEDRDYDLRKELKLRAQGFKRDDRPPYDAAEHADMYAGHSSRR